MRHFFPDQNGLDPSLAIARENRLRQSSSSHRARNIASHSAGT
jgi:hypothetical protein